MKSTIDKLFFVTAANNESHYMGVPAGAEIWDAMERQFSHWLRPEQEGELVEYLSRKFKVLANNG